MTAAPLRFIRASTHRPMPWKNGGGWTVELAVEPAGAGFDDFLWRISMADVASDGPFSTFPGIDRTLVLLEGAGIVLTVDGHPHRLDPATPALSFPGDRPTKGALLDGPVRDFNVMTRRGRYGHRVDRIGAGAIEIATTTLLFAHAGACSGSVSGTAWRLDLHDALQVEPPRTITIDEGSALSVGLTALR